MCLTICLPLHILKMNLYSLIAIVYFYIYTMFTVTFFLPTSEMLTIAMPLFSV